MVKIEFGHDFYAGIRKDTLRFLDYIEERGIDLYKVWTTTYNKNGSVTIKQEGE